MRRIDELHMEFPFAGARMLARLLRREGHAVGRRRMRALARVVEDPERRRALMLRQQARSGGCGPPKPVRPVLKLLKMFDYDGEINMAVAAGGSLPVIEITPVP